jgi:hypothetical protein
MGQQELIQMKEVLSDLEFWFPTVVAFIGTCLLIAMFNALRRNN